MQFGSDELAKKNTLVSPAIAQLVEHLTVDSADIRWSLVRFRVAGFCVEQSLTALSAPGPVSVVAASKLVWAALHVKAEVPSFVNLVSGMAYMQGFR